MKKEQLTDFKRKSYEFQTENLSEEICKALCFLLKEYGSETTFEENFPSLSKQRRSYDAEFQKGDEVRTIHGLEGIVSHVSGEKPSQEVFINLEDYLVVDDISIIGVPSNLVKMAFDRTEFSDDTNIF